jgi:lipopolysaccharide biosynthesis protein
VHNLIKKTINLSEIKLRCESLFDDKRVEIFFIRDKKSQFFLKRMRERLHRRFEFLNLFLRLPTHQNSQTNKISLEALMPAPGSKKESLVIPFADSNHGILGQEIAVHAHIYYEEEIDFLIKKLKNIPTGFGLFISTNTNLKSKYILKKLLNEDFAKVTVRITENRGRDISPLLLAFPEIFNEYEYLLHIHTKKSLHNGRLQGWYYFLIENLIGSREVVHSILSLFEKNPALGIVAPEHFYLVQSDITWGGNFDQCKALLNIMGVLINKYSDSDFPAGSMFWSRVDIYRPILDLGLELNDFEKEAGQTDATLAHAIERIFYYSCELAGYTHLKTIAPTFQDTGFKRKHSIGELDLDSSRLLI